MRHEDRKSISKLIRSLLSKTVESGCTESEAMAAALKAGELMDRYSLTFSDIELNEERCRQSEATDRRHEVCIVATSIARFCGCRYWLEYGRVQYFGLPCDVDIAVYLTSLCRSAMEAAFRAFLRSPDRPGWEDGRSLRKPYMVAMAQRLSQRIDMRTKLREATATTANGTALMRVRDAVVDRQFDALGIKLVNIRGRGYSENYAARAAGWDAGGRVNITSGIRKQNSKILIGFG